MKKITSILLLFTYTLFNIGLVVNTHYCGGEVASVSLYKTIEKRCNLCGETSINTNNCCKDSQSQYDMDDNQIHTQPDFDISNLFTFSTIVPSIQIVPKSEFSILNKNKSVFHTFKTGPPTTPIYIKNQSLII